jgi:primase-polymerase (primpol)-like protein
MQQLPDAFAPMAAYAQFILYKLAPRPGVPGKTDKFPCDLAGSIKDAHDASIRVDAATAVTTAAMFGPEYGVGFVFTEADPFYFFDIDDCLLPSREWSPMALELIARFPGAAVEISQSGSGLHIFGTGSPAVPAGDRRKKAKHPETGESAGLFDLYTEKRFVALTGTGVTGNAGTPADQAQLDYIVDFWLKKTAGGSEEWTTEAVEGSTPIEDDDALIAKACSVQSAAGTFGKAVSFKQLWEGDDQNFGDAYPDDQGVKAYDASRVDAALAQHLAFWTGNNSERILRLMRESALTRGKWDDREEYLINTITRATALQESFYSTGTEANAEGVALAEQFGAVKLRASSEAQRAYGDNVRADKLAQCAGSVDLLEQFCKVPTAKFWLDNKDHDVQALSAMLTPVEQAAAPLGVVDQGAQMVSGFQYLGATQQVEYFAGCVYIQEQHKVFAPTGALLKPDQFNATYGGYVFQLDDGGEKTTRKAWEAFTESQVVRYPKAEATCFRPQLAAGALIEQDGRVLVNTYVPVATPQAAGDVTPFLAHLAKNLPVESDRAILLAYMAACIQYKGVKFQWAPLLQGAPGNGKTLYTRCVAAAIGERYTHFPPANEIAEKYNDWLFDRLFIGVEDVYVQDHKKEVIEVLKPMITNDRLAKRAMQQGQVMGDVCANFLLNSNHKDGIRKTRDDRRFAVFYTLQQTADDVVRDGMGGNYFPDLYDWLKGRNRYQGQVSGYAIVSEYLATYPIPAELNPAGECHRAPETSSTNEAITASLGGIEQEVLEAIDEGRQGFAGGWISSMALERLLDQRRKAGAIPPNKRRELLQQLGYDWHPALNNGRVNNPIPLDGGKPRLFIRDGHISANLATAAEVVRAYQAAQDAIGVSVAKETFAK